MALPDDTDVAPAPGDALREAVERALSGVIDPELGVSIVELGLVYALDVDVDSGRVHVALTMTTPACPLGEELVRDASERISAVAGVRGADVELVWEPAWTPDRMSSTARAALGWDNT